MARISLFTAFLLAAVLATAGCSGLSSASGSGQPPPPSAQADHVFLVVLENHSFSQVVGNPAMPFLNSLATQHSMAANYFANAHPSIPNYFMLSTGNVQTFDDDFSGTISADNLVRSLTSAKKTWKVYAEGLPSVGYTGPSVGTYLRRHNPFSFLSDVTSDPAQAANMVPFSQFSSDLNAGTLANFVYLLPDREQDAHDCPGGAPTCPDDAKLAAADSWLQANIGPLLSSPNFGNSVLIITWDESIPTDLANGGGQVLTLLAGPHVKTGFSSTTLFQHQSVLRLIVQLLSATDMPGASANANAMGEFFQ